MLAASAVEASLANVKNGQGSLFAIVDVFQRGLEGSEQIPSALIKTLFLVLLITGHLYWMEDQSQLRTNLFCFSVPEFPFHLLATK